MVLVLGAALSGMVACGPRGHTPDPGEYPEPAGTVALTFDDLPFAGSGDPAVTRPATAALLKALADARAPAAGFVVGSRRSRGG